MPFLSRRGLSRGKQVCGRKLRILFWMFIIKKPIRHSNRLLDTVFSIGGTRDKLVFAVALSHVRVPPSRYQNSLVGIPNKHIPLLGVTQVAP